ncbi:MAG: hypothetical protein KJ067_13990 [Vicinamibacteria bacterium]|nr:hypothetical protein [Vicinamibacteria bacterium]
MAAKKKAPGKTVEALRHEDAKRRNIPTAEFQSVLKKQEQDPLRLAYERRNRDLDPQLVWRGKDEQDWSDLVVQAPPLYIQEKVHPKVLIDDLLRQTCEKRKEQQAQIDLFADFNGIPEGADKTDFYQHDQNWSNRMILGDSLQVMASLAEREGLRGKVQCIYMDPPYGIKFNSNFQWSTTSRDVKDGNVDHITREPEQVKAFRDTWRDGIHSYLTYLRDRLTVARDLLTDSGSIFVQIGDENVHRVRAVLDEVFGEGNLVAQASFKTTDPLGQVGIAKVYDYIVWHARNREPLKFRPIYRERDISAIPRTSSSIPSTCKRPRSVAAAERSHRPARRAGPATLPQLENAWGDKPAAQAKRYVVETAEKFVQRCLLMATDPGDLVLDPTCGSGTTATVAEQWGRRWITVDTSRVALVLARAWVMGARFPFYPLADSQEGRRKQAEVTESAPSNRLTTGSIRQGLVFERASHVTLADRRSCAAIPPHRRTRPESAGPLLTRTPVPRVSRRDSRANVPARPTTLPRDDVPLGLILSGRYAGLTRRPPA